MIKIADLGCVLSRESESDVIDIRLDRAGDAHPDCAY